MPSLPPIRPEDESRARRQPPVGAFDPRPVDGIDVPLVEYLLRLGDDSLVLGQRLSEWTGALPTVEVELSIANIALDLIGQANLFLGRAGEVEGRGRDGDRLAFHRDVLDFRNCLLVEQPNGDFARTMARQFLFSTWQKMLFEHLIGSSDELIAAVAAKAVKEVAYHQELSADWMIRLGDGTEESRARMEDGLAWNWRFIPELFAQDEVDLEMIERGIGANVLAFRDDYFRRVGQVLAEATLETPADQRPILGGRTGHHSEHLGHILSTMQFLPRAYPEATW